MLGVLVPGALALALGAPAAQAAIVIDDVTIAETNGVAATTFTITRTAGVFAPAVTVSYATADGTAQAPGDYTAASGAISFPGLLLGGTQQQHVTVSVQGDRLDEDSETFRVELAGPEISKPAGLATIVDDDPPPAVGVLDAAPAVEGAVAVFTIALSAASGRGVAVAFATADGSALAGQDYTARGGTITIPAGSTSASLGVPLTDDAADEPDETFGLRLSGPANATLGDAAGVATIVDNDQPAASSPPAAPATGSGAGAPGAPGSSAAPATGSSAGESGALPQLGVSSPRLRRPSTILLTLSCPRQSGRCGGRVTIFSRPSRRSRIKALRAERRLARRTFGLAGGASQTLAMALSKQDLALLRRAGRISVRAYVVTQDAAGRTGVRRVNGTLVGRTSHSG